MTSSLKGKKGRRSESICTHRKVLLDNDDKKVQRKEAKRRTCRGLQVFLGELKDEAEKEKE